MGTRLKKEKSILTQFILQGITLVKNSVKGKKVKPFKKKKK